jgi:hypothetical protein
MTNDLVATTRHRILFNATTKVSRSIADTTQNLFASSGANPPLIQNSSAVLHLLNFPILLDPTSLTVDAPRWPAGPRPGRADPRLPPPSEQRVAGASRSSPFKGRLAP